ncbi:unnamed protein product, partial [Mesorhabditis spiculigera]
MSCRRIQFALLVLLPVLLLAQEIAQEELRPFVAIMPPFLRMDRRAISKFIQTRQEPKRYANTLDKVNIEAMEKLGKYDLSIEEDATSRDDLKRQIFV